MIFLKYLTVYSMSIKKIDQPFRVCFSGDRFIDVEEIQHIDQRIKRTGILSHCRRRWCIWCDKVTVINYG